MLIRNILVPVTVSLTLALAWAQPPAQDNTRANKRDRQKSESTADQQKEDAPDRELAKNIRQALMHDKSLSTYAHNVKVIVEHGMVTLKGPVRSEEEKRAVELEAAKLTAPDNIKNELTVAPKPEK